MNMPNLKDITIKDKRGNDVISLAKLVGEPVTDVIGYLSDELGGGAFKITHIVLHDGTYVNVEGEHDFPYITDSDSPALNDILSDDIIDTLYYESEE